MLVKEIMKGDVVTVDSNEPVFNACLLYRDRKIGCLVVVEKGKCIGIVTERDLIERTICEEKNPKKTKIGEIMTSKIKTIHALDKIEKAIEIMKTYKIKKLPVLMDNRLVGIITVTDISKARPELSQRFVESWVKPVWRD